MYICGMKHLMIICLLAGIFSCKKFEDDHGILLQTVEQRMTGEWQLQQWTVEDTVPEVPYFYARMEFFKTNNAYFYLDSTYLLENAVNQSLYHWVQWAVDGDSLRTVVYFEYPGQFSEIDTVAWKIEQLSDGILKLAVGNEVLVFTEN